MLFYIKTFIKRTKDL